MIRVRYLTAAAIGCWLTAWPLQAQSPTVTVVGAHGGAVIDRAGVDEWLIGAQTRIGLFPLVALAPMVSWRPGFLGDPTGRWRGTAWQVELTARLGPLGPGRILEVGYGIALRHAGARDPVRDLRVSHTELADAAVIALSIRRGRVQPMVELHMLGLLDSFTEPRTFLVAGVNLGLRH